MEVKINREIRNYSEQVYFGLNLRQFIFSILLRSCFTQAVKWDLMDKNPCVNAMKAVQGDSGHSQLKMIADVYSHIIDEDRRLNADKMEAAFYSGESKKIPNQLFPKKLL